MKFCILRGKSCDFHVNPVTLLKVTGFCDLHEESVKYHAALLRFTGLCLQILIFHDIDFSPGPT